MMFVNSFGRNICTSSFFFPIQKDICNQFECNTLTLHVESLNKQPNILKLVTRMKRHPIVFDILRSDFPLGIWDSTWKNLNSNLILTLWISLSVFSVSIWNVLSHGKRCSPEFAFKTCSVGVLSTKTLLENKAHSRF